MLWGVSEVKVRVPKVCMIIRWPWILALLMLALIVGRIERAIWGSLKPSEPGTPLWYLTLLGLPIGGAIGGYCAYMAAKQVKEPIKSRRSTPCCAEKRS